MNELQKTILERFSRVNYACAPSFACHGLEEKKYILRRNVNYLTQKGFLKLNGYRIVMNKLFPLYNITEEGRKESEGQSNDD